MSNQEHVLRYLSGMFPELHRNDGKLTLEAVYEELIGTRQVRIGGCPSPEIAVSIRDVLRHYMAINKPIPILSVFAPKKPDGGQVDIAELSALYMIQNLQERIQRHYKPGIEFRARIEDLTGSWLEGDKQNVWDDMNRYSDDFDDVRRALGLRFASFHRESHMFPRHFEYITEAKKYFDLFYAYIVATDEYSQSTWDKFPETKALQGAGWIGHIPMETRRYYYSRYSINGIMEPQKQLARYYTSIRLRNVYGFTGAKHDWADGKYIYLSFAPQIPGVDDSYLQRKIYYRSIPMSVAKGNVPFWRAKGIFELNGETRISLVPWHDARALDVFEDFIELQCGHRTVRVQADYILK